MTLRKNYQCRSNQNPGDAGSHEGGQCAAEHRAQSELGQVAATLWYDTANSADLNSNRSEVRESAQRIDENLNRTRAEVNSRIGLHELRQFFVGNKFVGSHFQAKQLTGVEAVARLDAHQPGKRVEQVAEDHREAP